MCVGKGHTCRQRECTVAHGAIANGTVVNGEEIFTERPPLPHGDQITIAGVTLTVMILPRWIQG